MNTRRITLTLASAAAALALAACSGGNSEETPPTETNVEVTEPMNMTELPAEAPAPAPMDNTVSESQPATGVELTADEQTQDDADAAGMTARVSRDEGGNESGQPAQ